MNKGALWNLIQVTLDVGVNYPPTPQEHFVNCADCLRSTALWPKPIRVILEISFEDWFDYYPTRLLDDSVADRRNPQGALTTIRLGYVYAQHRLRFISPRL
jgi:hypothetical protein